MPGGGTPRALKQFSTYQQISTWMDSDPLTYKPGKSNHGSINNNLLSQTIALFFNRSIDPNLDSFELSTTFATAGVACGSSIPDMTDIQIFSISPNVINYLNSHGGATVGNLFVLANLVLGKEVTSVSASDVNGAVDAINRGFDECRIEVSVPSDFAINSENVTEKDFTIYPVPFISNFTIQYNFDYESPVDVQIFDSLGNLLLSKTDKEAYKGKEMVIEFPQTYQKGQIFLVRIQTNKGHITKTIVSSTN